MSKSSHICDAQNIPEATRDAIDLPQMFFYGVSDSLNYVPTTSLAPDTGKSSCKFKLTLQTLLFLH